jgi:hypothetical protein
MATDTTYLIVGASLAGAKAAQTLREEGFDGPLLLIGEERERPYERPPLSKDYLQGKAERETIYLHPAGSWWLAPAATVPSGIPAHRWPPSVCGPFAAVDRGAAGDLAATGRLGGPPVDGHTGQLQPDDLVVGAQRQGVEPLGQPGGGPLRQASPDRAVRAPRSCEALIARAVHQRGHHVVEHHPVGDPTAVAAKRMVGVEGWLVGQPGAELAPDRFQQACWHGRHGPSWDHQA